MEIYSYFNKNYFEISILFSLSTIKTYDKTTIYINSRKICENNCSYTKKQTKKEYTNNRRNVNIIYRKLYENVYKN